MPRIDDHEMTAAGIQRSITQGEIAPQLLLLHELSGELLLDGGKLLPHFRELQQTWNRLW
jgi:hypothetical protein